MANLINWGKVYISSYFGVGVTSNTISWGKIYRDLVNIAVSLLRRHTVTTIQTTHIT